MNAFGDVIDPHSNQIIAGTRTLVKGPLTIGKGAVFADTLEVMKTFAGRTILGVIGSVNTVIGAVITNASLSKEEVNKVAQMAQDGLALAIRPAHTMQDGDTCLRSHRREESDVNLVGPCRPGICEAILHAAGGQGSRVFHRPATFLDS